MKNLLRLMALLMAFQDSRSAYGQGILGLTAPRPGDLPVAPGKSIVDRHYVGSSWYSYANRPKVGGYIVNPSRSYSISRVTLLYLSPPVFTASQPIVILPAAQQNRAENQDVERVSAPASSAGRSAGRGRGAGSWSAGVRIPPHSTGRSRPSCRTHRA